MFHNSILTLISRRACLQNWNKLTVRLFHPEFTNNPPKTTEENASPSAGLQSKYDIFRDEDSPEIFDVEEEKRKYRDQQITEAPQTKFEGLNLDRRLIMSL